MGAGGEGGIVEGVAQQRRRIQNGSGIAESVVKVVEERHTIRRIQRTFQELAKMVDF